MLELALVRYALEKLSRRGVRAGDPAGAGPRARAVRHRLPARHRAADLPAARRRAVPGRHLGGGAGLAAPGRDPRRRTQLPAPLRRLLDLLPPRGRRGRQGHARDLPRAPVRQGRDVLLRRARGVSRTSTSGCWRSRSRSCQELGDPLPRGGDRGRRPRRLGGQEVRLRGLAARPGPLPRADLVLEHHRLSRPGGWTSATARRTAGRRTCTRSTAPRSRSGGRSSRCSRTASARTAPCGCRRRWSAAGRRRCCRPTA